ncbi:(2Fe-2S)-binding protein [Paenibacillus sedimenti]|uniref:(2Fe-2S)-binding protein n=1 Tax=Paenibacillus sedimenti TaxID=2770274 RepID=A0A926KR84_9BACL|nr:(2Fe-2S)-binding protein [Paenibacillus sedimenti]MBD0382027.1 (2Fe-2S)-binding protein [Paenibacillus sedimenti]
MEEQIDFSWVEANFRISPRGMKAPILSVPGHELLNPEIILDVLRRGQILLQATDLSYPASHTGITIFNLCLTFQLFIVRYNRVLDLSLNNLVFELENHNDHTHAGFKLTQVAWKQVPSEGRDAFIEGEWKAFVHNTIGPVIDAIAVQAKVKPDLIWNQYGARMVYYRDYITDNEPEASVREQFLRDYDLLAHRFSPDVFGRTKNPFDHEPRYIPSPYEEGKRIIIRSSCCMYYRREEGRKCFNCPLMKEEERQERREQIEQARAASGE